MMTTTVEASSISSSPTLQLSVEQWELLRRLRNSHLTKQQIIRAYDELDRLDRELGNVFNSSSSSILPPSDPISPSTVITQQISPSSSTIINNNNHNKRSHSQTISAPNSRSSSSNTSNGYHLHTTSPSLHGGGRPSRNNGAHDHQPTNLNQYEVLNSNDLEEENRELQELLSYVLFIEKKIFRSKKEKASRK